MVKKALTNDTAIHVVVFVGAFSAALVIAAVALAITAKLLNIEIDRVVEWLIPALIGVAGGTFGVSETKKRRRKNG